jgi:hypothetical protein
MTTKAASVSDLEGSVSARISDGIKALASLHRENRPAAAKIRRLQSSTPKTLDRIQSHPAPAQTIR